MAAFSYQLHQPFHNLVDSMYNLQSSQTRMSALLEDQNIINTTSSSTTSLFPQFYQLESLHQLPAKSSFINGSGSGSSACFLDQTTLKVNSSTLSNNDHSLLTNKTLTDSSSVTDKLESGEQVTQNVSAVDNKRKLKEGPSLNSAQSAKGVSDRAKGKKQRKCSRNMKDDEEKKSKEENKRQKKVEEEAPTGYIHVRARRGQATDSHSLAERVRREKISERMKILQALVPGCDKVTGKALMLDEIINYVQSLQNQVEFLSMKLASLNPLFYDYGMDLDCLMARPEQILSNMASPAAQNLQQCETIDAPIISDTGTTLRTDAAANSFSQLDTSASAVFFPQPAHPQIPQILSQANGQLLWDVDEQRQKLINNQTGFSTNLCSFH